MQTMRQEATLPPEGDRDSVLVKLILICDGLRHSAVGPLVGEGTALHRGASGGIGTQEISSDRPYR